MNLSVKRKLEKSEIESENAEDKCETKRRHFYKIKRRQKRGGNPASEKNLA